MTFTEPSLMPWVHSRNRFTNSKVSFRMTFTEPSLMPWVHSRNRFTGSSLFPCVLHIKIFYAYIRCVRSPFLGAFAEHIDIHMYRGSVTAHKQEGYGVVTIRRLLKTVGLWYKRALQKRLYSAKETYNFKEPTSRSYLIRIRGIRVFFDYIH